MGLFHFLIVVMGLVAAGLVTVILMQQSEGGGLGMGGSPSGVMSARGAADFMTRLTTVLAVLFVITAIALATVASNRGKTRDLDTSFERGAASEPVESTGDAPAVVGAEGEGGVTDGMVTPADANAGGADEEIPLTR